MAIIWQKKLNGRKYEVRSAGQTRRLYTNGVCHSEFNLKTLLGGSIWDLLLITAFFYPAGSVRRVLMLGVGGGACIRQLQALLAPDSIDGVELDPVHLEIARRFFSLPDSAVTLHHANAAEWLQKYRGQPFDMIIDDLFIDHRGQPERALDADSQWFTLLLGHLAEKGQLVINFGGFDELRRCGCFRRKDIGRKFPSVFSISGPLLENRVGVFLRQAATSNTLRSALLAHPVLGPALKTRKLRYHIRSLATDL